MPDLAGELTWWDWLGVLLLDGETMLRFTSTGLVKRLKHLCAWCMGLDPFGYFRVEVGGNILFT